MNRSRTSFSIFLSFLPLITSHSIIKNINLPNYKAFPLLNRIARPYRTLIRIANSRHGDFFRHPLKLWAWFTSARDGNRHWQKIHPSAYSPRRWLARELPQDGVRLKRISISIPATDALFNDVSMPDAGSQRIKVHPVIGNGSDSFGRKIHDWITVGTQFTGSYLAVVGLYPQYSFEERKYANDLQRKTSRVATNFFLSLTLFYDISSNQSAPRFKMYKPKCFHVKM